ncbi:MAG TPA: NAD(P)/FAD-dependent oxidoreductase [Devosiaceae bacterium]|jgi:pyruvate/2-oxoglutarate dehydrogenase complex dihydrolipoamide dehydrogenase (E3) component
MADIDKPDLCVIGGGNAGLRLAMRARALGASVILVEPEPMGTERRASAGIALGALTAAGQRAQQLRGSAVHGIAAVEPKVSFRALHDHVAARAAEIARDHSAERCAALGIAVVAATGSFRDRKTLVAGERLIRARRFAIATGIELVPPAIPGLTDIDYFTPDTIVDNARKLSHLLVIGAGPVGLALAQAYRRLGGAVTVVDAGTALPGVDPEFADLALRRLREEGLDLRDETRVTAIKARGQGIGVTLQTPDGEQALDISHVLLATGRQPAIAALDPDKAGIRHQDGALQLRQDLRTTNPIVFALGGAADPAYEHQGLDRQVEAVISGALLGRSQRYAAELVPSLVPTDPAIASIGLTEATARQRFGTRYRVTRAAFAETDAARAAAQSFGTARLITDPAGRILGASIIGSGAAELIGFLAFAAARGINAGQLADFAAPYPALAELIGFLGKSLAGDAADAGRRRLLAFRRRLP